MSGMLTGRDPVPGRVIRAMQTPTNVHRPTPMRLVLYEPEGREGP